MKLSPGTHKALLLLRRFFSTASRKEKEPWLHLHRKMKQLRQAEIEQEKRTTLELIRAELAATKEQTNPPPLQPDESKQRLAT